MESDDDSLSELSDVSDKPKVKRPVKAASTTSYVSKRPTKRELAESEPLDFSTIRTSAPIRLPPRSRPRLFGLEHCPVYYPTEEEFADPITCIQRYARDSQSAQAGIFKVVPPSTWKPPFVLDTQVRIINVNAAGQYAYCSNPDIPLQDSRPAIEFHGGVC